jgi:hypothetical protein
MMKKFLSIVALFTGSLFISCGENEHAHDHGGESRNAAAEPASPTDSLLKEVFVYHDEAMPKMGKLKGYEDLAKLRIDSLSKLGDAGSKALKADYERLMASLRNAQQEMDDWMGGFKAEKFADKDSLYQYYLSEKDKAKAMRNSVFNALDSAKARFGQ